MAVFGWSDRCLATHPSDVAVALVALEARLMLEGPQGSRMVPLSEFYLLPGETPDRDTVLEPGELITRIHVPFAPVARRSHYLKVRARLLRVRLVSAAVALDLDRTVIRAGRVVLGGVAPKPWRLERVESALRGIEITRPGAAGRHRARVR